MKSNIKKIIGIMLAGVILMYLWTGVALADTAPINFDSFEDMPSNSTNEATSTNNTSTPVNNTSTTNNIITSTSTNTDLNSTKLPQTGSNTEMVFIIGITVLAGTAIVLYNKTKIK